MSAFTFDTSGAVTIPGADKYGATIRTIAWSDLSPFAKGYVEAAAWELCLRRFELGYRALEAEASVAFRNWSPSALARALEDCERFSPSLHPLYDKAEGEARFREYGGLFLRARQAGHHPKFPPLLISLSDDGKVETRGRDSAVADIALTPKRSSTEALPVGKED